MQSENLKKPIRLLDLVIQAGRKRFSSQTGFVHEEDRIPIYQNFCLAFALLRLKTTDSVIEGRALIEKLFGFQTPDGNFPVYLHDFPRCFDPTMPLKLAPLFIYTLRFFGSVLGSLKPKMEETLAKFLQIRPEKLGWENRYRACVGEPLLPVDSTQFSAFDWTDWIITAQLAGQTHFSVPFDADLQVFLGKEIQEKGEPQPNPVEWLFADGDFSARLLRDHPDQLFCAPLFPATLTPLPSPSFRLLWKEGSTIHSIFAKNVLFDLANEIETQRNDLFEAVVFTNISEDKDILVQGKKATSFQLGEPVEIRTPTKSIFLTFQLIQGSGDFHGHIYRANRPTQCLKGYEAYDWQIGLRTLRRGPRCQIQVAFVE